MSNPTLHAHSIAEIHLFLMATPCQECGRGPLAVVEEPRPSAGVHSQIELRAKCKLCEHEHHYVFAVASHAPDDDPDNLYPIVNPTDSPSQILDVGHWIVLSRVLLEKADKEHAKIEARRLGYKAAQCLAEAIKFYDDNDLPPESAVWCDSTRTRLRDHPEQFSRDHLLAMRAKLPALPGLANHVAADDAERAPRPWWRFWGPR